MKSRSRPSASPTKPLCPTTPGGIPVRLLVDAEPRSLVRRGLPLLLAVLLAVGIAAVALAGCGARGGPRPPAAVVNRVQEIRAPAPAVPAYAEVVAPSGRLARVPR